MNKILKLTLAATVAAAMLGTPAFAQSVEGNSRTVFNPNSPTAKAAAARATMKPKQMLIVRNPH